MEAPAFGPAGQSFWDEITSVYGLSPAEMRNLAETCKTLDILTNLAAAIAADGCVIDGSRNNRVINPAITEARGQRVVLHRLIAALQIPDIAGKTLPTAKGAARTVVWAQRRAASAS